MLEALFNAVVNFLGHFGYWGIAIGMFIESVCIPLPSEIILPFGGFLAAQGTITFTEAALAGQIGGLVGSTVAYFIGRYGGRVLLERYGKYVLISTHELDVADKWFAEKGEATVFIGRLLPGVRTFISLPAGIAEMNFGKFIFYSFLGMLPWTFLFTYLGLRLGNSWGLVRQVLHRFDLVIIVLLVAAIGWFVWSKLRRREA